MSKCRVAFCYESPTQRQTEREKREARAVPILTLAQRQACSGRRRERKRGECCKRVCVCVLGGQTFPWQDPRDPAEGRVQTVKERLHARQSISGLHLHNKWELPRFLQRSHTRAHTRSHHSLSVSTQRSSPHADARSERWGGRKRKREEEASYLLEWHSTNTNSLAVSETQAEPQRAQSY